MTLSVSLSVLLFLHDHDGLIENFVCLLELDIY